MSDRIAEHLNRLTADAARAALTRCCGAGRWVERMEQARPFRDDDDVFAAAERLWWALEHADWREAFAHHPRIGESSGGERGRAGTSEAWSREEQSGTATASPEVHRALVEGNRAYERRFGHVFLICATGKSAEEMLAELRRRLRNSPSEELMIAAGEQAKITRLRLEKLVMA